MRLICCVCLIGFNSFCLAEDPYLASCFQQGLKMKEQGQFQEAANSWVKYIEMAKRLDYSPGRIKEVEKLLEKVRPQFVPAVSPPAEMSAGFPQQEKQKPFIRIKKDNEGSLKRDPAFIEKLIKRAEKAEYAGHYEESRRLIGLALQYDPTSELLQKKSRELDKLME